MPPGGDGFYYFSTYLSISGMENNAFEIHVNGDILCTGYSNEDDTTWPGQAACNAAVYVTEGINCLVTINTDRPEFSHSHLMHLNMKLCNSG